MEITVSVLRDAAESLDKVAKFVRTLGQLLADSAKAGVYAVDWVSARSARKITVRYLAGSTSLAIAQGITLVPTVEDYIKHPENEGAWPELKRHLQQTLDAVSQLREDLGKIDITSLPYDSYQQAMMALVGREHALNAVLNMREPPTSSEAIAALKHFLETYLGLLSDLQESSRAIAAYVETLKRDGKWPISGY